jgi:hypothetical protein
MCLWDGTVERWSRTLSDRVDSKPKSISSNRQSLKRFANLSRRLGLEGFLVVCRPHHRTIPHGFRLQHVALNVSAGAALALALARGTAVVSSDTWQTITSCDAYEHWPLELYKVSSPRQRLCPRGPCNVYGHKPAQTTSWPDQPSLSRRTSARISTLMCMALRT